MELFDNNRYLGSWRRRLVLRCTIVMKPKTVYIRHDAAAVCGAGERRQGSDGVINVVNGAGGEIAQRLSPYRPAPRSSFTSFGGDQRKVQQCGDQRRKTRHPPD